MEERIKELERKVETMTRALLVLQKWMDSINSIGDDDTELFQNLNDRILKLEILVDGEKVEVGG